ncbi:hypothetical protein VNO77_22061 [Canavalia gladiata]|uniref:Uncharacterized protein n=1 Tax=Canavalia gladiata TaxID=3824 RepID=A0AAN9L4G9_CANGL
MVIINTELVNLELLFAYLLCECFGGLAIPTAILEDDCKSSRTLWILSLPLNNIHSLKHGEKEKDIFTLRNGGRRSKIGMNSFKGYGCIQMRLARIESTQS